MKALLILFILTSSLTVFANSRTVMVQLFEWPWNDVARECEVYLGPNGFSAVQVSPPQEHLVLGQAAWWERYQPVSYKISSRSGDEFEFQNMIQRCRNVGVDVYVDVILNHMAGIASGTGIAGTKYTKYNHQDLYSFNDFHHCGRNGNDQIVNYKDRFELQNCELLGLADLKTESPLVQQTLAEYLNQLLNIGVTGFRLDAAKHIPATDLVSIFDVLKSLTNISPFVVSETSLSADEPINIGEYLPLGHVNYFRYSYDIGAAFSSAKTSRLAGLFNSYVNTDDAVVFLENHDLQRTESSVLVSLRKNPIAYRLATVFFLTWPYGYPQLFSGFDFSNFDQGPPVDSKGNTLPILDNNNHCRAPWLCEHRLPGVAELVKFRNHTDPAFYADGVWMGGEGQLAFSRGKLGFVAINTSTEFLSAQIPVGLPSACYCNVLAAEYQPGSSCSQGVAVRSGYATVSLDSQSSLVLRSDVKCKLGSSRR